MAATRAAVLEEESKTLGGMRLVVGYAAVAAILAAATSVSIVLGHDEHAAPGIAGFYKSSSACLGSNFKLGQSGQFVDLGSGPSGKLRFRHGHLTGDITCKGGGAAVASDLAVQGKGATAKLAGAIGASRVNLLRPSRSSIASITSRSRRRCRHTRTSPAARTSTTTTRATTCRSPSRCSQGSCSARRSWVPSGRRPRTSCSRPTSFRC